MRERDFRKSSRLKRSERELRGRTSQERRRGSSAAAVGREQDLERRSEGDGGELSEGIPARRSRRQRAQKPVMGAVGWRWQAERRWDLGVMSAACVGVCECE